MPQYPNDPRNPNPQQVAPPPPTPPSRTQMILEGLRRSGGSRGVLGIAEGLPLIGQGLGFQPGSPGMRAAQAPLATSQAIGRAPGAAWRYLSQTPVPETQEPYEPPSEPSMAQDIELPASPTTPPRNTMGFEMPEGMGPSSIVGAAPVRFKMGLTTPEDRADLQATRARMNTGPALEGLRARQPSYPPYQSDEELYRLAFRDPRTVATGAPEYWQNQLRERVGEQEFGRGMERSHYELLAKALGAQHPAVQAAAEQEARRAAMPAQASALATRESARLAAGSRENVAETQADEQFITDLIGEKNRIRAMMGQMERAARSGSDEAQARFQRAQQDLDILDAMIAAFYAEDE